MREESHLDDMRSAIRGDFERLAARRGGQDLMQTREDVSEPEEPPPDELAPVEDERDAEPEARSEQEREALELGPPADVEAELEAPAETGEPVTEPVTEAEPEAPAETGEPLDAPVPEPEVTRRRSLLDRLLGRS